MTQNRMSDLRQVAAMKLQAVQADLARLSAQEAALRDNLIQLQDSKRARAVALQQGSDTAHIAGADMHWHQWADQRRSLINTELAQVLAQKAECLRQLQQAFGKEQAIITLMKTAKAQVVQDAARRKSYES